MHRPALEHKAHDHAFVKWGFEGDARQAAVLLRCSQRREKGGLGEKHLTKRDAQPYPGFDGGKVPYHMSMYAEPEFRHRGLGTMVTKNAIEWAREFGYESITLHASKMGRPRYVRGWVSRTAMKCSMRFSVSLGLLHERPNVVTTETTRPDQKPLDLERS